MNIVKFIFLHPRFIYFVSMVIFAGIILLIAKLKPSFDITIGEFASFMLISLWLISFYLLRSKNRNNVYVK